MKLFLWIGWGLILAALALLPRCERDPGLNLVAARDLKPNRLLAEGDVVVRGGERYLRRAIGKGRDVTAGDLVPWPDLEVRPGSLAVALPIVPADAAPSRLNAGEPALLCPPAGIAARRVRLTTVLCQSAGEMCAGIIELTPAQAASLAGVQARGKVVLAASCPTAGR